MPQRLSNQTSLSQEAGVTGRGAANKPLALGSTSFFAGGGSAFSEVASGSELGACSFRCSESVKKNGGGW